VPLSPQALRVVEQVRRVTDEQDQRAGRTRSEWLFPNPMRRADHIYECQKLAQRVRRESKVDYRAHDFRRTAASMMTGSGVRRLVVSKILNHAEPGTATNSVNTEFLEGTGGPASLSSSLFVICTNPQSVSLNCPFLSIVEAEDGLP